jgi:hypothetical protein
MTAVLDRTPATCPPVSNGPGCPRTAPTTTTTAPRADGCALTGGNCPGDQATIDTCDAC